ncbi:MAG: hypothetical protein IJU53_01740 [Thermoguttaceae bacterium]|nr:hypothetical protein [Thermoguttaceae bacterium]
MPSIRYALYSSGATSSVSRSHWAIASSAISPPCVFFVMPADINAAAPIEPINSRLFIFISLKSVE